MPFFSWHTPHNTTIDYVTYLPSPNRPAVSTSTLCTSTTTVSICIPPSHLTSAKLATETVPALVTCSMLASTHDRLDYGWSALYRRSRIGGRTDSHGKTYWLTSEIVKGGGEGAGRGRSQASRGCPFVTIVWLSIGNILTHKCFCGAHQYLVHHNASGQSLAVEPEPKRALPPADSRGKCLLAIVLIEEAGFSADGLIKEVMPWFDHLCFFPEPARMPVPGGSVSSVHNVGDQLAKSTTQLRRFENKHLGVPAPSNGPRRRLCSNVTGSGEEVRCFCIW